VPADLGGMRTAVDRVKFNMLKEMCETLNLCLPSAGFSPEQKREKELFQDILSSSDVGLSDILERQFNFARKATMCASGTAVLGDNVVGRQDVVFSSEKK